MTGQPPEGPRPPRISPAWAVALHEAGHCVVAHAVGWQPVEARASRSRGWAVCELHGRRPHVWLAAYALAGTIAERRAHFSARWSNFGPRRPILQPRFERRPRRHPDGQPEQPPTAPNRSDDETADDAARAAAPPSDPGGERYLRSLAYWTTCRVLQAREPILHRLADALYRHGHLSGDEIADVLSDDEGLEQASRLMLASLRLHARRLKPNTQNHLT